MAGKQKVYQDSEGSYYAMQDMTSDICNSVLNTGESTTARLVDTRDHNIYYVTKLKDNHCWMTQNLDLDINGPNTSPLTSENTDISTTASGSGIYSTAYGYSENNGVWTWEPGTTTSNIIVNYNDKTANGWENSNTTTPYSAEGSTIYIYTSDSNNNDIIFNSLQACKNANHSEDECEHYHVGNYYNWTAAIASNNSSTLTAQYANAENSICPRSWRLPIATNESQSVYEFGDLLYNQNITTTRIGSPAPYAANGFNNIRKAPLWFIRGGVIVGNKLNALASFGGYRSNITGNYYLGFDSSYVYPANTAYQWYGTRERGFSIRCIAK
jgi:uncharacterized protein (TIGR02145 family)